MLGQNPANRICQFDSSLSFSQYHALMIRPTDSIEIIQKEIKKQISDAHITVVESLSTPGWFHVRVCSGEKLASAMLRLIKENGIVIGTAVRFAESHGRNFDSNGNLVFRRQIRKDKSGVFRYCGSECVFAEAFSSFIKKEFGNVDDFDTYIQQITRYQIKNGTPLNCLWAIKNPRTRNPTDFRLRGLASVVNVTGFNQFDEHDKKGLINFLGSHSGFSGYMVVATKQSTTAVPVGYGDANEGRNLFMVRKGESKAYKLHRNLGEKDSIIAKPGFVPTQLESGQTWGNMLQKKGYLVGSMKGVGGSGAVPVVPTVVAPLIEASGSIAMSEQASAFRDNYYGSPSVKNYSWGYGIRELIQTLGNENTKFIRSGVVIESGSGKFGAAIIQKPGGSKQGLFIKRRNASQRLLQTSVVIPSYIRKTNLYNSPPLDEMVSFADYNALPPDKQQYYLPAEEHPFYNILTELAKKHGISVAVSETASKVFFSLFSAVENDTSAKGYAIKAGVGHMPRKLDIGGFTAHAITAEVKSYPIATHAAVMAMPREVGKQFLADLGFQQEAEEYGVYDYAENSSDRFGNPLQHLSFWQDVFDRTQKLDKEENLRFLHTYGFGRTPQMSVVYVGNRSEEDYNALVSYLGISAASGANVEGNTDLAEKMRAAKAILSRQSNGDVYQAVPAGSPVMPLVINPTAEYPASGNYLGPEQSMYARRNPGVIGTKSYRRNKANLGKIKLIATEDLNAQSAAGDTIIVPESYTRLGKEQLRKIAIAAKDASPIPQGGNPAERYKLALAQHDEILSAAGIQQKEDSYGFYLEDLGIFVPDIRSVQRLGVKRDGVISDEVQSDITYIQNSMADVYQSFFEQATMVDFPEENFIAASDSIIRSLGSLYRKFNKGRSAGFTPEGYSRRNKTERNLYLEQADNFGGRYMQQPGLGGGNIYIPTNMLKRMARGYGLRSAQEIKAFVQNSIGFVAGFSRYPNVDTDTSVVPLKLISQQELMERTGLSKKQIRQINRSHGEVLVDPSVSELQQGDSDKDPYTIFSESLEKLAGVIKSSSREVANLAKKEKLSPKERAIQFSLSVMDGVYKLQSNALTSNVTTKESLGAVVRAGMNRFSPEVAAFKDAIEAFKGNPKLSSGSVSETTRRQLDAAGHIESEILMRRASAYDTAKRDFVAMYSALGRNANKLLSSSSRYNQIVIQAGYQQSLESDLSAAERTFVDALLSSSKLHYSTDGRGGPESLETLQLNLGYARPPLTDEERAKGFQQVSWLSYKHIKGLGFDKMPANVSIGVGSVGLQIAKSAFEYYGSNRVLGPAKKYQMAELFGEMFGYSEDVNGQLVDRTGDIKNLIVTAMSQKPKERYVAFQLGLKEMGLNFDKSPITAALWGEVTRKFSEQMAADHGDTQDFWTNKVFEFAPASMVASFGGKDQMVARYGMYEIIRNTLTGNVMNVDRIINFLNAGARNLLLDAQNAGDSIAGFASNVLQARGLLGDPATTSVENVISKSINAALRSGPKYLSARDLAYHKTNSPYFAINVLNRVLKQFADVIPNLRHEGFDPDKVYQYSQATQKHFASGNDVEEIMVRDSAWGFGISRGASSKDFILQAKFGDTTVSGIPDFIGLDEVGGEDIFYINEAKVGSSQRESGKYQAQVYVSMMYKLATGSEDDQQVLLDYLTRRYEEGARNWLFRDRTEAEKQDKYFLKEKAFVEKFSGGNFNARKMAERSLQLIQQGKIVPSYIEMTKEGKQVVANILEFNPDTTPKEVEEQVAQTRDAIARVSIDSGKRFVKQVQGGGSFEVFLRDGQLVAESSFSDSALIFAENFVPKSFWRMFGIAKRDISGMEMGIRKFIAPDFQSISDID